MCEPGSHESHRPRETDCGSLGSAEPVYSRRRPCRHRCAGTDDDRTPRGRRGRYARTEWIAKARNHSRVAQALPHSEGIAYKPPCGENAMCPRVGRMYDTLGLFNAYHLIERFFKKIKKWRRAASRYDKLAANYLAFIKLASIRI